jgi:PAS domain S-box-containing protein
MSGWRVWPGAACLKSSHVEAVKASLPSLLRDRSDSPSTIPDPSGTGTLHIFVTRFSIADDIGGLIACSRRADFPSERDRLLLSVGANQTAIVIQNRRAEQLLDEQREWLRVTLASIGDGVITTDTEGRVTFLNAIAASLTGWTQNEAAGQSLTSVFNIVNEHTRQTVENPALRALREGHICALANHSILIARDGSERDIEDSAAPIRTKEGKIGGAVLVFRDVSERRRLERQIAAELAAARLLAAIVESSEDAIISKSLDGIIQTWNAAAERLFGYTAEQAVGRHISLLFPADRAKEEEEIIARIQGGERVRHFDTVRVSSDGQHIPVALTISPIRDEAGRIVGASKIARDITDRKENEKRHYDLMAELKQADKRKEEFLATLAHELRNPLATIRNSLELIRHAKGDSELIEDTRRTMERQMTQMVRLVEDLMDVNRISQNKLQLRKERIDLAAVMQSAVETSRPLIEQCGHQLTVTMPQQPILLDGDLTRLVQAFANLLTNAAKYTEPGGRIWLTAERVGSNAVVKVKDTGIGIPAEALPTLFEMFTQVDRSLGWSQGGLGIGLTLVKRLTEMHGGTVEAHSDGPSKGSEFTVRLPVVTEKPKPPKSEAEKEAEKAAVMSGRRILVVDDLKDSAQSLAMLLKLMGNEVRTAYDGEEAVRVAEEYRPEVILLDIGLPKLNGYEAARRIRERLRRNVQMIALSGWGGEEDRRRAAEAGFNAHMTKPVELDALQKLLHASVH